MGRRWRDNFGDKSTKIHTRPGHSNQKTHTRYFQNLKYDVILGGGSAKYGGI